MLAASQSADSGGHYTRVRQYPCLTVPSGTYTAPEAALSALISDQDLVKAVRSETASHDYDEVILATGRQDSSLVARIMSRDPVQQLRRKWGQRLIEFPAGHRQESPS